MQTPEQIKRFSNSPLFWVIIFLVCVSPLAFTYMLHYVDELHYTDAAIQMLKSHDFFTPRQINGDLRFLKPVITYWLVAGSYELFGITRFSSRLPFVICGILLLWVTYKIAFRLTQNRNIALLALLITASNPLLILSSSRSIPDIPQALFFAIGGLGLTGLIISDKPGKKDTWLFYLGFALAFATKGIPAAVFFLLSVLFLLFNPWKKLKITSLLNWPAIAISLIIALFWYILMYTIHGNIFILSFYNDQLGERISENHFRIIKNAALALLTIIGYYTFWIIPAVWVRLKEKVYQIQNPVKMFSGLTFTWSFAMFLFSTITVKFYDRYFLPVFPMLSVFVAVLLSSNVATNKTSRYISATNIVLLITGTIISLFSAIIAFKLGYIFLFASSISLLIILSGILFFVRKNKSFSTGLKITAGAILLLILSLSVFTGNFALPDQGTQIADYLKAYYPGEKAIVFYGQRKVAAKINVANSGELQMKCIEPANSFSSLSDSVIIYREDAAPLLNYKDYRVSVVSEEWKSFPVLQLLMESNIEALRHKYQIHYKIAVIR
jgi:4-amino-4-deoxy-L-arabinose transferase-like glycosyltransferase